jgi:hypothetical protein
MSTWAVNQTYQVCTEATCRLPITELNYSSLVSSSSFPLNRMVFQRNREIATEINETLSGKTFGEHISQDQ